MTESVGKTKSDINDRLVKNWQIRRPGALSLIRFSGVGQLLTVSIRVILDGSDESRHAWYGSWNSSVRTDRNDDY